MFAALAGDNVSVCVAADMATPETRTSPRHDGGERIVSTAPYDDLSQASVRFGQPAFLLT
jgi:hypothetical protein